MVYKILDYRNEKVLYIGLCESVAVAVYEKIKARRKSGYHLAITKDDEIIRNDFSLF